MWSDKQDKEFTDWYKKNYWGLCKDGPDGKKELPVIYSNCPGLEARAHEAMWQEKLTEILGPRKAKAIYKIRKYGPETVLHKVFSGLWLCYGPVFKNIKEKENA